jgi:hypothetical protein
MPPGVCFHPFWRQRVSTLSFGQRKRTLLLAALIGDPWLLLLDEPTNGLDPEGVGMLEPLVLGPGYRPFLGVTEQLEIWKTEGAGGVGVPGVMFFGYRLLPLSFGVGIGVNAFTVDWQGEETAFGIYSPRAAARLGLEVGPMYVLAEAEVQRRWRWTLDDITAGQIGLTLGYLLVEDMTR